MTTDDDPNAAPQPSAALLLATSRQIASLNSALSASEVQERAQWAVGRGAVGLTSLGSLYLIAGGIEDARKAGLVADGSGPPIGDKTPRERRNEQFDSAQKILAARMEAARAPRPTRAQLRAKVWPVVATDDDREVER